MRILKVSDKYFTSILSLSEANGTCFKEGSIRNNDDFALLYGKSVADRMSSL